MPCLYALCMSCLYALHALCMPCLYALHARCMSCLYATGRAIQCATAFCKLRVALGCMPHLPCLFV